MRKAAGTPDKNCYKVLSLRKAYDSTQIAIVGTPPQSAEVLLRPGKPKGGWVMCRLRERTPVTTCFKCLGFGHLKVDCRGPDRSDLCCKCGQNGHKSKEYTREPHCVFCEGKENCDPNHISGSAKCPVFMAELRKKARR